MGSCTPRGLAAQSGGARGLSHQWLRGGRWLCAWTVLCCGHPHQVTDLAPGWESHFATGEGTCSVITQRNVEINGPNWRCRYFLTPPMHQPTALHLLPWAGGSAVLRGNKKPALAARAAQFLKGWVMVPRAAAAASAGTGSYAPLALGFNPQPSRWSWLCVCRVTELSTASCAGRQRAGEQAVCHRRSCAPGQPGKP